MAASAAKVDSFDNSFEKTTFSSVPKLDMIYKFLIPQPGKAEVATVYPSRVKFNELEVKGTVIPT